MPAGQTDFSEPAGGATVTEAGAMQNAASQRILQLIDFLADFDARRNPPVYDVATYGLYLLREVDLPDVPGVTAPSGGDTWLAVDFVSLPLVPPVPPELQASLPEELSPHTRPAVERAANPTAADLALAEEAERWV